MAASSAERLHDEQGGKVLPFERSDKSATLSITLIALVSQTYLFCGRGIDYDSACAP